MGKASRDKGARFTEEVWKPIVGYEGRYEVSNMGRIKSLPKYHRQERIMKPYTNPHHGYVEVHLSKNGKAKPHRVHKLVMEAFTDYRSKGYALYQEIDHIDGDKTNNALSNLQVVTHKENMRKAHYETGINYRGVKCIDLDTGEVFNTYEEAAKSVGGRKGEMIRRVCIGKRSHYRNHHFAKYDDYIDGSVPEFKGKCTRKASESLWAK